MILIKESIPDYVSCFVALLRGKESSYFDNFVIFFLCELVNKLTLKTSDCFHVLTIVISAAMTIWVHVSF